MANEIQITSTITWKKYGATVSCTAAEKFDQVGSIAIENVQIIGIASEAILLGDVTDPAYILFKNEDETNTVHIGVTTPATSVNAELSLEPGQGTCIITEQTAWYAIAENAPVNVLVFAIQR